MSKNTIEITAERLSKSIWLYYRQISLDI